MCFEFIDHTCAKQKYHDRLVVDLFLAVLLWSDTKMERSCAAGISDINKV
jgi:hypothetical protein